MQAMSIRAYSLLMISFCVLIIGMIALGRGQTRYVLTVIRTDDTANHHAVITVYDMPTGVTYHFSDSSPHQQFVWSPNGIILYYQTDTAIHQQSIQNRDYETYPVDGMLLPTIDMVLAPDGTQLVYGMAVSNAARTTHQLHTLDTEQRTHNRLTTPDRFQSPTWAQWLPDHQRLIVRGQFPEASTRFALLRVSAPDDLTYFNAQLNAYEEIVPVADERGYLLKSGWEIAQLAPELDATPQTLITGADAYTHIAIAPDGDQFAFIEIQERINLAWTLRLYDFTTGTLRDVIRQRGVITDATWSPDGAWLAYLYDPPGAARNWREVYIIRPDGTQHQRVMDGFISDVGLAWQPR